MTQELGKNLRFDFIIYNADNTINRFIEFDGKQHESGMSGGSWSHLAPFETIQTYDNLKNQWCLNNHYTLIRIPYVRLNKLCLDDIMGDTYIYKGSDELCHEFS